MEKLSMCRICLAADVRMHIILNTHLQDLYEKLTVMPLETKDARPILACYICYARLQNCYQLRVNCLRSEELLTQMLDADATEIKQEDIQAMPDRIKLAVTPVIQVNVVDMPQDVNEDEVKIEVPVLDDVDVKIEEVQNGIVDDNSMDQDDHIQSSDPEDDIPLKMIKNKSKSKVTRKKKARVRKKEPEDNKRLPKVDAREIILSKEEQLLNLEARAKSTNYTLSPFKCQLCYKGFIDEKAYDNHKMKHDKRSGPHECDVCRMRYSSVQQLRTHAVSAHSRIFRCNQCGHTTHTHSQARVHEKWHSGFTYECQLCGHKFRKPTSYLSHMRKRHPTEHVCDLCGESFVGKHGLIMHKSKTHRNEEVKKKEDSEEPASERYCIECDIQFHSKDAWKRHILSSVKHTLKNETSTECSICEWRGENSALSRHLREHQRTLRQKRTIPKYLPDRMHCRCSQCGVNFISRSKLQGHINRMHLGLKYNKNVVCEICGKHCTSNATLKYHQRTHTGERPYACSTCSKQFADSNQLRIHVRTHTGEKPYRCGVCDKRFSQKPALNRHYRVHTGVKPYGCQYCSRTFSQSNSLKLHVKTVHLKLPANTRTKSSRGQQQQNTELTTK